VKDRKTHNNSITCYMYEITIIICTKDQIVHRKFNIFHNVFPWSGTVFFFFLNTNLIYFTCKLQEHQRLKLNNTVCLNFMRLIENYKLIIHKTPDANNTSRVHVNNYPIFLVSSTYTDMRYNCTNTGTQLYYR